MRTFKEKSKGFTLVETLVAISILMIAVAGPLTVANKGLNSALYSKDQMIATFLAQESLEAIKFKRDKNLSDGLGWLDGLARVGRYMDVSGLEYFLVPGSTGIFACNDLDADGCAIYLTEDGYTPNSASGGQKTVFSRRYELNDYLNDGYECDDASTQCVVKVTVFWHERLIPYSIQVSSLMTNQ